MILISHRGNINGKIPELENNPKYLQEALDKVPPILPNVDGHC